MHVPVCAMQMTETQPDSTVASHGPSVFNLKSNRDIPRFDMPLLLGSLSTASRSCFACAHPNGERFLLTTASSVAHATKVEVWKPGEEEPYLATVSYYCADSDLAALSIVDNLGPSGRAGGKKTYRGGKGALGAGRAHKIRDAEKASGRVEELMDDEDRFWEGVVPLQLGPLPNVQQAVEVRNAIWKGVFIVKQHLISLKP